MPACKCSVPIKALEDALFVMDLTEQKVESLYLQNASESQIKIAKAALKRADRRFNMLARKRDNCACRTKARKNCN